MELLKKFKKWIIGIALGGTVLFGATLDFTESQKINTEVQTIISRQDRYTKYRYEPKAVCGEFKCEVNEYKTPKGEKGLQIYIYKDDGSVESIATGPQADWRTYIRPPEHTPTTTKEKL